MSDVPFPDRVRAPRRPLGLAALLIAEAMNLLDSTIVAVAAPNIHDELGGPVTEVPWFAAAYTLPFATLLLIGGRLGDVAGRRRVFAVGVVAFVLASLSCALSPSVGVLVASRAVQGAAAAMVVPQTIGLIKAMFTGPEVSRALGTIGPVMGLAAVLGPVLGGVLVHLDLLGSSWRAVFLVNVPLSVLVLVLVPCLPESRAPRRPALDLLGTLLATVGVALVVHPLVDAGRGLTTRGVVTIVLGLAVVVVFGRWQRFAASRGRGALLEVSLFRGPVFRAALVASTLFFAATTGLTLVVVVQMQLGQGVGVLVAGLTLVPWSLGLAVASWVAGAVLVPRCGGRVMRAGLAVLLVGLVAAAAAYLLSDPGSYPVALLPALGLVGLGVGLFTPSFFTAALAVVTPQETGSAAGVLNAVQQLGGTLGVAVLGSVDLASAGPGAAGARHGVVIAVAVAAVLVAASAGAVAVMTRGVTPPRAPTAPTASPRSS